MKKSTTPSFVLTLKLRYAPWQRDKLDKMFKIGCFMYNNLVGDRKKALKSLECSQEWHQFRKKLSTYYSEISNGTPTTQKQIDQKKAFHKEEIAILEKYGMSEYAFQSRIKKWSKHYGSLIGSTVVQKIASQVWYKFSKHIYGISRENIYFLPWQKFQSIEGKTNKANIRFELTSKNLFVGKMVIPVLIPDKPYETEALKNRIKYCRIIRIPWKDGWLYKLQLVIEGSAPVKKVAIKDDKGKVISKTPLQKLGKGRVGLNIGKLTLAHSATTSVKLEELADKVKNIELRLARVSRALNQSRKATNPAFFDSKTGDIIKQNKLDPRLIDSCGKRKWITSLHYKELDQRRRYLYAKATRIRRCQHQEMANKLLLLGDVFYINNVNFQALAKESKRVKRKNSMLHSRNNKAPSLFVTILSKKIEALGGCLVKVDFRPYNHRTGECIEKPLFSIGSNEIRSDLYSAFLLMNTNATADGFMQELCEATFENFISQYNKEIERLKSKGKFPSNREIVA